ncbi:hypothetical protein HWQ46_26195 [Shewanella sp. D64]|uniref:hypothetical protein n=1 Tax=unclassified Shewanella TaxID=196818 RepID=UPI0022BA4BB2|nr:MULTISPECIES: hypothetical protein [unclassified Shewanella]MEC4729008.1 hypothetical protein [Shewanella sp. D64]MEC4740034.1 hypothetical protein [Shewanella sp. E94]WBJ94390.1 hypothetical protein HWQ47_21355 [Shewanella sp. MTB7]
MQIKVIIFAAVGLLGALILIYREGYDSGFNTALSQLQESTIKQADAAINVANEYVAKEEAIVSGFMANQTDFLNSLNKPDVVDAVETEQIIEFAIEAKVTLGNKSEVIHDEQESPVRVVGIDADELRELQRLTRSANAH